MSLKLRCWCHGLTEGKRTCSGTQDSKSHANCAHLHTHFLADKTLTALVQWCVCEHHACSHLRAGIGAVKDHKANTSLTTLTLDCNEVGDAGAAAFAKALQATVLTCKKCVFRACVCCQCKCRFTKSSEELASTTCFAVRVAAFVTLLVV